jgi:hypothetical protein
LFKQNNVTPGLDPKNNKHVDLFFLFLNSKSILIVGSFFFHEPTDELIYKTLLSSHHLIKSL